MILTTDFGELGIPIENGLTFEENAKIKSEYFYKKTRLKTLSDDSGFIINQLKNYPGIRTARVSKELGGEQAVIDDIFDKCKEKSEVEATFYCALALIDERERITCLGKINGKIIPKKIGDNGFGYDPFFIPDNQNVTFAQMTEKEKMLSSHRFDAFKILVSQIQ